MILWQGVWCNNQGFLSTSCWSSPIPDVFKNSLFLQEELLDMKAEFPVFGTGNFGTNLLKSGLNLSRETAKMRRFCLNSLYFPAYQGNGWRRQVRSSLYPPPVISE
jgi:hypothetical protein